MMNDQDMMKLLNYFFRQNVLYKNSFFLIANNIVASGSGFIFWILVARLYTTEQIGIATSLFSLVSLLSTISLLGLNVGLMRYLPLSKNRNEKINSSIFLISMVSCILAIVVLFGVKRYSPPLAFITGNLFLIVIFITFTIFATLNILLESIFVAFQSSKQVLYKSILQSGVKLVFPFLFISLGSFGIIISLSLGALSAVIYGLIVLSVWYEVSYRLKIHGSIIKQMGFVSFGNYIAGISLAAPMYILPILITNIIGPSETAYYYIATTTANLLFMLLAVVSQNLLVVGSYKEKDIKLYTKKAVRLILMILISSIILLLLFGNYVLQIFGKHYSTEGIALLRLLALSGIFVGFNSVLGTLLTVFHHIKFLIAISSLSAIIQIVLSINLLHFGLIGVGYSFMLTQFIVLLLYIAAFVNIKKISILRSIL